MQRKERTGQPKLTFEIDENHSKEWIALVMVKDIRVSDKGTVLNYEIVLPNGHITTRHRRFMRKEITFIKISINLISSFSFQVNTFLYV